MGLETGTWIEDLVPANPLGTDPKSQGDDHIQLIKSVLQNTLPGAGQAFDLNQMLADIAANTAAQGGGTVKNQMINGDMSVWQRAISFLNVASDVYTADRWFHTSTGNPVDIARSLGENGFAKFAMTIDGRIGNSSTIIMQRIESVSVVPQIGKVLTASFRSRATDARAVSVSIRAADVQDDWANSTQLESINTSILTPNVWETLSVTFAALDPSADLGLELRLNFGALVNSQSIDITNVQFERSDTPSNFEFQTVDKIIGDCQRYFEVLDFPEPASLQEVVTIGQASSSASALGMIDYRLKRVDPVVTTGLGQLTNVTSGVTDAGTTINYLNATRQKATILGVSGAGLVLGDATGFVTVGGPAQIHIDAELF